MQDERPADVEVLVCRKCLMRGGARSGGMDLPRWLQGALAERGLGDHVRVLPTGCMSQCPRGQVTVLVTRGGAGRGSAMVTVDPRLHREQLVRLVEKKARGTAPAEAPTPPGDGLP
jgi:predicted metal-binding protein